MNLLVTTQVFPPEAHPSSIMVDQLARFLAARGHDVTVACGHPIHPSGRLPPGWSRALLRRERRADGVRVLRGWHATSASRRVSARGAVWLSQALGTGLAALAAPRPDVVLNYGPPLVGPLLAGLIARARGAALASIVFDLYPDVAIETGKVRSPALIAAARWAERAQYRLSDRVVVLSEGFRRTLAARGVPPGRIVVLPVWLEEGEVTPLDRDNAWRARAGIGAGTKVVLYAGTVGWVSGARVVLEAAERLRHRGDVLFLFVGEGQVKDELERAARQLPNVRFLPLQPRADLALVQATADVSLVTLAPGRGRTSVPSKVIGYMAAGRPVVASVDLDSDTADEVRDAGCGVVVPPGDPAALARAVEELVDDGDARTLLGERARRGFEERHGARSVLARYAAMLEELAGARRVAELTGRSRRASARGW